MDYSELMLSTTDEPYPWPKNWRELYEKCPKCDRCGTIYANKLYLLSEVHANIYVCGRCSDDYHQHIQDFIDEITQKKNK